MTLESSFNFKNKKFYYLIILLIFSILFNQYYGFIGVFPEDSFLIFNSGYDTLNGHYPFKDFYTTTGPLLDVIQAIFFKIFGISWFSYVLHASVVNSILTLATFHIFAKFKLNLNYCFFYSLLVAILAYPSSGTPFMDHHSTFISIIALFSFILALQTKSNFYWYALPFILGFAFLSKQVPASYILLIIFFLSTFFFYFNFSFKKVFLIFISGIIFIIIFLFFLKIGKISLLSFLEQYIFFPRTLGASRLELLFPLEFSKIVLRFKLQHLSLLIPFVIVVKKIKENYNYLKSEEFIIIVSLISTGFALIILELMTINEKFIFFIIPIFAGFSHIYYLKYFKEKKYILNFLLILTISSTFWYHYNYIDSRKFLTLNKINIKNSINAKILNERFSGLKWITVLYPNDPIEEISKLKEALKILKNDSRKIAIITDYQFISVFLNSYDNSPNRVWHEGANYPLTNNKYFKTYKKFFINNLRQNEVKIVYTIMPLWGEDNPDNVLKSILNKKCIKKTIINNFLNSYLIENCSEIK